MLGGINNIDIINASQRGARDKLNQMAGIKRPPSGILASSPELINAVGNAAAPAMPVRTTGPATPMPMVQAALPQIPVQTAVATAPRPMAPAPAVPTVPQPASPTTPMKFQDAGPVDIRKTPKPTPSDPLSALHYVAEYLGNDVIGPLINRHGSPEKAEQAVQGQVAAVEAAVETGNPENIANTVIDQAGLPLNDESKRDFARTVFGLDDVNDIDEINRRIADVAIGASIGKGPDKFAQAVLLGLQNYKQTASARAAAKAGGGKSGMSPLEPFPDAVRDLAGKIMQNTGADPADAIRQAEEALARYYSGQVTAEPSQEAPTGSGLPTVTTKEEYDALPSGSEFMQNGQRRRKP